MMTPVGVLTIVSLNRTSVGLKHSPAEVLAYAYARLNRTSVGLKHQSLFQLPQGSLASIEPAWD